jgi:hypothetical protein
MSYESGKVTASVTGSVNTNFPTIPAGATLVFANFDAGAGTADIYTVTAGKTLYIAGAWCCTAYLGASSAKCKIQADCLGTGSYKTLLDAYCYATASVPGFGNNSLSYNPPVTVPATKKVQSVIATSNCLGGFWGWEL